MTEASNNWWIYEELANPPLEFYEELQTKKESEANDG